MTLYKKGSCKTSVVIFSAVYSCSCGHTEIVEGNIIDNKKCSKCGDGMRIISSQTEAKSEDSAN